MVQELRSSNSSTSDSSSLISLTGQDGTSNVNQKYETASDSSINMNHQSSPISNTISSTLQTTNNLNNFSLDHPNLRIMETRFDATEIISQIENELAERIINGTIVRDE
jgi:hypothetical protein